MKRHLARILLFALLLGVGPAGAQSLQWLGSVSHWPPNGSITSNDDLWIDCQSWQAGAAVGGDVVYSVNAGTTWTSKPLSLNYTSSSNDFWHSNLGKFPAGTTVRYALNVRDATNYTLWDNKGGADYTATVNGKVVYWAGNTIHRSLKNPEAAGLAAAEQVVVRFENTVAGGIYRIARSTNLVSWGDLGSVQAAGAVLVVTNAPSGAMLELYRAGSTNVPLSLAILAGDQVVIRSESWPSGNASGANVIFTTDGSNWQGRAMTKIGAAGNNDLWEANLGLFPPGTVIEYAIEVTGIHGNPVWDNNGTSNYTANVIDPNAPDTTPPVVGHSPQNTTVSSPTLAVSLSATDDHDPSPVIYYTTNGAAPTAASPVYAAPIVVTDKGAGIDLTIRAIAVDVSANTSAVHTVDVRVNESFVGGPFKPYSVNPTLGKAVANGAVTINGNASEWATNMLIALDLVNDDPRSLGNNWTMHEAPADLTHLWAAWDDDNLYLAWQFADITDKLDPANAGSALGGRVSNSQGILQFVSFDTIPAHGAVSNMWSKNDRMTGSHKPEYQTGMRSDLYAPSMNISHAPDGEFPNPDGGSTNYATFAARGITVAKGELLNATQLWGVPDVDHYLSNTNVTLTDYVAQSHDGSRDSFYEMKIPFSALGITRSYLESAGIGVMINVGSTSSMDTIPNDSQTLNTGGVTQSNSSFEWEDTDLFTAGFARIGQPAP